MYAPEYENSWALIVGINKYQFAPPLQCARSDAEAVAQCLVDRFTFSNERISLLVDEKATREAVLGAFLKFANGVVEENDRVFVFFAGHGHTHTGRRGEVGYLVPSDGNTEDLSTLLRWDELTRNSDLIAAKHILFIMDACYGGLAVTRGPGPGGTRFLKSMLQRFARQVLTAGKADEAVSDSGGPIPDHSVFTGHFLQALEGAAASEDGIICANNVMSYVYERVAKDLNSRQTPHFGFIDGDGDFIFQAPMLDSLLKETQTDDDVLIEISSDAPPPTGPEEEAGLVDRVKELISDRNHLIALDDLLNIELRKLLAKTSDRHFPSTTSGVPKEDFLERLQNYEELLDPLQILLVLFCRWGTEEHLPLISKVMARSSDNARASSGTTVWLALRWYPSLLLLYSGGIAAVSAGKYENLATLLTTPASSRSNMYKTDEVILSIVDADLDLRREKVWKWLPGHERQYVPRSEYLFKLLQPTLDDLLFLGNGYDTLFDRFEVLLALVYADLDTSRRRRMWAPAGRFAWKDDEGGALADVIHEAKAHGDDWAPLRAGLFGNSLEQFLRIAQELQEFISKLGFF